MAALWYRHSVRRSISAAGADRDAVEALMAQWGGTGDPSLKALLRAIVASDDFATLMP